MATKMVAVDYTVEGRGEFPLDMLRYDQSYPKDESETGNLIGGEPFNPRAHRRVRLSGIHHPGWQPTAARWESFLWHVVVGETSAPRTVN